MIRLLSLLLSAALALLPVAAAAQVSVTADRIYLGATGCAMRTGSGAPTGGAPCDFYLDTSTGHTWVNAGGTWINVSTVVAVSRGGTGQTTLTANGVLYGSGTNPIGITAAPVANSLLQGTAGAPTFSIAPTVAELTAITRLTTPLLSAPDTLTITPAGDLILDPAGRDVIPGTNFGVSLGTPFRKFLSLHLGELWAETLVAQDVTATIGGRVMVAPTTMLTVDLAPAATTITVKHNNLFSGDRVVLQAAPTGAPQVEWLAITSTASGAPGAYTYSVTRNLDGTGANQWYAGDAILNTGTTGKGFIDLYTLSGVLQNGYGPTIVGQIRTGPAYNAVSPRWAVGNLNALGYGHTVDLYGAAFGDPSAANLVIDTGNGVMLRYGSTPKVQIDMAGNATFTGAVNAASGTIGGFTILADRIRDAADSFGLSSVSGGDAVRFWAGATFANRDTAPLRITSGGTIIAANGSYTGTFYGNGGSVTNINGGNIQTGTITATAIAANAITADKISAGSVTADKIASGSGTNVIRNSECRSSTDEWTTVTSAAGFTTELLRAHPDYSLSPTRYGPNTCSARVLGLPPVGQFTYVVSQGADGNPLYPAQAGRVYEASVYLGTHNGTQSYVSIQFYTADALTNTGEASGTICSPAQMGGTNLAQYCRSSVIATAPANTGLMRMLMYQLYQAAPPFSYHQLFFTRAYLGEGKPNQTQPSEWTPAGISEITGGIIKTDTIQANHIAAGAITAVKIAANSVTSAHLQAGTITSDDIGAQQIQAVNIATGTITAGHLAAGTITGDKIAGRTITAGNLIVGTITGAEVSAGAINTYQLASSSVSADRLQANSVNSSHIQANSITADRLSVSTLSAISANLGTINAGTITGVTINGTNINGGTIDGATVLAGGGDEVHIDGNGIGIAAGSCTACRIKFGSAEIWSGNGSVLDMNAPGGVGIASDLRVNGGITNYDDFSMPSGGSSFGWTNPPYVNSTPIHWSNACQCIGSIGSSARFKENIRPWAPDNPLAILTVPLVRYDLKAQPAHHLPVQPGILGMLAEDLYKIAPEAVVLDAARQPAGINPDALTSYLLAALRATNDRIPRLEQTIRDLETRLAAVEAARAGRIDK